MVRSGLAVWPILQFVLALVQFVPSQIGCNAAHVAPRSFKAPDIDWYLNIAGVQNRHRKLHQVLALLQGTPECQQLRTLFVQVHSRGLGDGFIAFFTLCRRTWSCMYPPNGTTH